MGRLASRRSRRTLTGSSAIFVDFRCSVTWQGWYGLGRATTAIGFIELEVGVKSGFLDVVGADLEVLDGGGLRAGCGRVPARAWSSAARTSLMWATHCLPVVASSGAAR